MRLLVCGSRQWSDRSMLFDALDHLHQTVGITTLIEGCAAGADRFAEEWARERGVPIQHFPANWRPNGGNRLDRSAGVRRNSRMLADGEPEYVVAFDMGTSGTADMVRKSREWGLEVVVIGPRVEVAL